MAREEPGVAGAGAELGRAEEQRLLVALADGDPSAAGPLVAATYETIFRSLVRMAGGDRELAADLTQETYRKAWASLKRFRGDSRFGTWLYRIAYTTFLNHHRRPRPVSLDERLEGPPGEEGGPGRELVDGAGHGEGHGERPGEGHGEGRWASPGSPDPFARLEGRELRRRVLALPEHLRSTVVAHYWQGLSPVELADLEGVTAVAIRKRLARAVELLRGELAGPARPTVRPTVRPQGSSPTRSPHPSRRGEP